VIFDGFLEHVHALYNFVSSVLLLLDSILFRQMLTGPSPRLGYLYVK
jgi:hypothetical protein